MKNKRDRLELGEMAGEDFNQTKIKVAKLGRRPPALSASEPTTVSEDEALSLELAWWEFELR